jgi:hypothetical protein
MGHSTQQSASSKTWYIHECIIFFSLAKLWLWGWLSLSEGKFRSCLVCLFKTRCQTSQPEKHIANCASWYVSVATRVQTGTDGRKITDLLSQFSIVGVVADCDCCVRMAYRQVSSQGTQVLGSATDGIRG